MESRETILIKCGEISLKGNNRHTFEDILIANIKRRLSSLGEFRYQKAQSTIYVEPAFAGADLGAAVDRLQTVFGAAALCRAATVEKDYEMISQKAAAYLHDALSQVRTFKVEAKRSDKKFPMNSYDICRELGGDLLKKFPHLSVDVHAPEFVVMVEIRDFAAYIHGRQLKGAGGIPVGSSGRAVLLLSGGIDSPVAGFMMAKRGIEIEAAHFESPPYTGERAKLKVLSLLEKMSVYCGSINYHIVNFTEIQESIRERCRQELFTILMRRYMMKISQRIADKNKCGALITGESLGQVASQTIMSIACTDRACDMPVFRPLIGMDKQEIISVAREIDTLDISTLPYEDCCTVFVPKRPSINPKLSAVLDAEKALDEDTLIQNALNNTHKGRVRPN